MRRVMTNLLVSDVERAARFYEDLLGLSRTGDFGWFVVLGHADIAGLELGLLDRGHDIVPPDLRRAPAGVILTFVVDDVDDMHDRARRMGVDILEPPGDLFYGQRRLLLRDPEGVVIDISSPVAP